MIKANELRISALVSERGNHRIYKVLEVLQNSAKVKYWSCGETETISFNKLMPIMLTGEIFEKAGFINNYKGYSKYGYWKDGIKITSGRVDFFYYSNEHIRELEIKNVHQLQNLFFALTGTELEIVL